MKCSCGLSWNGAALKKTIVIEAGVVECSRCAKHIEVTCMHCRAPVPTDRLRGGKRSCSRECGYHIAQGINAVDRALAAGYADRARRESAEMADHLRRRPRRRTGGFTASDDFNRPWD